MNSKPLTQYDSGFIGPWLDWTARYDKLDQLRNTYAHLAAEDLLKGKTEMALRWARRFQELDDQIKRITAVD